MNLSFLAMNITVAAALCEAFHKGNAEEFKWCEYRRARDEQFAELIGELYGWKFWRPGCRWTCP